MRTATFKRCGAAVFAVVAVVALLPVTAFAASAAAYNSHDVLRCSGGYYLDGATYYGATWFCYFPTSSVVGESPPTAALRAAAGTSNVVYNGGPSWSQSADNATVGANSAACAQGHMWIGPTTYSGVAVPAGGVVFQHATADSNCAPYLVSANGVVHTNSLYNGTTCPLSGATYSANYSGCVGVNYAATKSQAQLVALSWTSLDYFPGGSSGVHTTCGGMVVSSSVGAELHYPGDSLTYTFTWSAMTLSSLAFRFTPSDTWHIIAAATSPKVAVVPWPTYGHTAESAATAQLEFRCVERFSGSDATAYQLGAGASFGSAQAVSSLCSSMVVKWPDQHRYAAGVAVSFSITGTGVGTIANLQWSSQDPAAALVPFAARTWTAFSFTQTIAGVAQTAVSGTSLVSPFSGIASVTLPYDGDLTQLSIRCVVGTSSDYGGQFNAGVTVGSLPVAVGCWDNAQPGLNPSSWVPSLIKGMGCLVQYLFVPSSDNLAAFTSSWSDSWLGSLLAPITTSITWFGTIASGGDGLSCAGPQLDLLYGSTYSGNSGAAITLHPLDTCSAGGMAIAKEVTWNLSTGGAVIWVLSRARHLYFSLVSP